jgi:Glucose / Sorbosone dehydrogenase
MTTRSVVLRLGVAAGLAVPVTAAAQAASPAPPDWRSDWALAEGFTLRRDAEGFRFPTAVVFVPRPGHAPSDPLYFVTELQGTIKVVTNDRTVHTFASDVMPEATKDTLPGISGESGLAGICLEPTHGYVFATFAYADSSGVLRNGLARFQATAGRFGLAPKSKVVFTRPFQREVAAVSHQIGPCQATPTSLFVSVGDGEQPKESRDLQSTLGKILRLTLDGRPDPSNPHAGSGPSGAAAYVWASGFRNPFGLKLLGSRLFVADNGVDVDRFLEVARGGDYGWDGGDPSLSMNAPMIFSPAVSPVQLDYCQAGQSGLPARWSNRFFVALSGRPGLKGSAARHGKGVFILHYGLRERRMLSVPAYLMQYRGDGYQAVVGLGCGPDAVYVVPIFPDVTGTTAILAVRYEPAATYPYGLATNIRPLRLMQDKGCFGCHSIAGKGGGLGPSLDRDGLVERLMNRLSSKAYRMAVDSVDALPAEPFLSNRKARHDVLALQGMDRVRLWTRHHIREPKFDNPHSQMPALDLTDGEAVALADFLLAPSKPPPAPVRQKRSVVKPPPEPKVRYRHVALAFGLGLGLGGAGVALLRRRNPT